MEETKNFVCGAACRDDAPPLPLTAPDEDGDTRMTSTITRKPAKRARPRSRSLHCELALGSLRMALIIVHSIWNF